MYLWNPKKVEFVETKTRVMVTRGWGGGIGEMLVKAHKLGARRSINLKD